MKIHSPSKKFLVFLFLVFLNQTVAQVYEVIDLGVLATPSSINDSGQVVFSDGGQGTNVTWQNGTLTSIGTLGSGYVYAHSINNSGQVVGEYDDGDSRAFISYNGIMTALNVFNNIEVSVAKGINESATIAGWAQADTGSLKAVRWVNGNMLYLGYGLFNSFTGIAQDINDGGSFTGEYVNQNLQSRGFVWYNNQVLEIGTFGGDDCRPVSINNSNQVVGGARDQNGNDKAFLWQGSNLIDLGTLGSTQSKALCINDSGQIVGLVYHDPRRAFIWEDGIMTDLNELSDTSSGWILTEATGINNLGYIIGKGTFNGQFASFLLKPLGIQVYIEDEGSPLFPDKYNLAQNYPNPFNPITTIQYSIPQRSSVTLKVYDVLGNEIAALVNEEKDRGVYSVSFDTSNLASGIYLYRLQAGSFIETKKMILIK